MHIFTLNKKPKLIITKTELLFRDSPTDEIMHRHQFHDIKEISLKHQYNTDEQKLYFWLNVQMKTEQKPHLIEFSSLDSPLNEAVQTLEEVLKNKVSFSFPKMSSIQEAKTEYASRKKIIITVLLLILSLFLFHTFYTPSLKSLGTNALKKRFEKNSSLCSLKAKAAYKDSNTDLLSIKSYCGILGFWKEMESKKIPVQHLKTEFSTLTIRDYIQNTQKAIHLKAYPSARKDIDKILFLNPKNAEAYLLLGRIDYESGLKEKAFKEMKKAVKLNPTSSLILNKVTAYYIKDTRYQEALVYANMALKLQQSPKELQAIANIESKLGQIDKAIQHFEKSLYKDKNSTSVYTQLGLLYWKTKTYKKAVDVFQKAYYLNPDTAATFLNYYEISLIEPSPLSTQEIKRFEERFQNNKDVLIIYHMLRIIKLSIKNEDIMPSLQAWDKNYSGTKLKWSFEEIFSWLDENTMDENKKYTIKKTIGFFIAYQQIYKLEHSKKDKL